MRTDRYTDNSDPYLHLSSAGSSPGWATHWVYNRSGSTLFDVRVNGTPLATRLRPGESATFTSMLATDDDQRRGSLTGLDHAAAALRAALRSDDDRVGRADFRFEFAVAVSRPRKWWRRWRWPTQT